jgi:hypothetical protein
MRRGAVNHSLEDALRYVRSEIDLSFTDILVLSCKLHLFKKLNFNAVPNISPGYGTLTHKMFGILERRDHLEDLGVDGRIILEWIIGKFGGSVWIGFIWLGTGISGGLCEHDNEPSGSLKGREFLDWLRGC